MSKRIHDYTVPSQYAPSESSAPTFSLADLSPEALRELKQGQEKLLAARANAGFKPDPRSELHLRLVAEALEHA